MTRGRWLGLGVLVGALVINLLVFFTYRVRQQERIHELTERKEAAEGQLLDARNARAAKDRQLELYKSTVESVHKVHEQEWGTPQQRLVPLILEIRALAEKSQLVPRAVSYTPTEKSKNEEITTIDIAFGVDGTYRQARHLIHLIEQSEQFVYIDSINLNGRDGDQLQLGLILKTLFRVPADAAEGQDS